jgi:hypothetical protein
MSRLDVPQARTSQGFPSGGAEMKLIGAAVAVVGLCALTAAAQEIKTTTKEKTKIDIKDGKRVEMGGCVARSADGHYILTNDVGGLKYLLVADDNLSKYVGRRVEVKGLATDKGDAKVTIEKSVGTSGEIGGRKLDDHTTKTKTEIEGDIAMPYLGVKSIKKLSNSCG